jgi:hypothetical protein
MPMPSHFPEAIRQARCRHLEQATHLRPALQPFERALQDRVALGMRYHWTNPAFHESPENLLRSRRYQHIFEFHQQVAKTIDGEPGGLPQREFLL